ncbi:MAG TPA: hypothetical protein VNU47_01955 [Candidatus Paceibacterota bacterium]|nr:hypothetical protein [Candidatus Paceibacterota bacterium]
MEHNAQESWELYRKQELALLEPILESLRITLDAEQPHIGGERYLMHAVTTVSGKKLILLGRMQDSDKRVVIKATRDAAGKREIIHERECRAFLKQIRFAYDTFFAPEELLFTESGGFCISVQAYIEQPSTFLARPTPMQFALALKAFKAQEGAHATTYEHLRQIRTIFGSMNARAYLASFDRFSECVRGHEANAHLAPLLAQARTFLTRNERVIEQYAGFLTHTDFVPHNFRVVGETMYLLDHSSIRFGNKYEGWARFINFMTLYNRELEQALLTYVRDNRTPEEYEALTAMRVYRLGEILCYYTKTLPKSQGALRTLNEARISFWSSLLESLLTGTDFPDAAVEEYRRLRDSLRSSEEKKRQQELH